MTEKRFKLDSELGFIDTQKCSGDTMTLFEVVVELNKLNEENEKLKQNCKNYEWYKQYKAVLNENEQLKIRNKGKQAFIDKQDKIIKLLYNQCKDFKEILDDSNITYPIDERLNKFFEEGVKL